MIYHTNALHKPFLHRIFILLLLALPFGHTTTRPLDKGAVAAISCVSVGISAASIYGFYRWLREGEKIEPSIDNLNVLTFTHTNYFDSEIPLSDIDQLVINIHDKKTPEKVYLETAFTPTRERKKLLVEKGISATDSSTIFIFSRGYARTNTPGTNDNVLQEGGCAMAAYIPIQDNVINDAPCITFDYPDRRRCFNFGQKKDARCLKFIHEQTINKNPNADIILIGDCRGAKSILEFACEQPKNVKALVLLSPFFSAFQLTERVSESYLGWLPGAPHILRGLFKAWFPNYDPHGDDSFCARVAHIPSHMPIFIAHRTCDTLVSNEQVATFIDQLRSTQHDQIHFVAVDDTSALHSRLTPVSQIQLAVNQFFSQYNLPHHKAMLAVG